MSYFSSCAALMKPRTQPRGVSRPRISGGGGRLGWRGGGLRRAQARNLSCGGPPLREEREENQQEVNTKAHGGYSVPRIHCNGCGAWATALAGGAEEPRCS